MTSTLEYFINSCSLKNENIITIPFFKKNNNPNFKGHYAITYKNILEEFDDINIINKEIKNKVKRSKPKELEWDIYLDPRFTDLLVIDIDDYENTMKIMDKLCKLNLEFNEYYTKLNEEIFSKTFTVQTQSGGKHYYVRRSGKNKYPGRKTKALHLHDFVDPDTIKNHDILSNLDSGKISIDYIGKGVVRSPWHNSSFLGKVKSYKIINNTAILDISDELDEILEYFFRFSNKKTSNANQSGNSKKIKINGIKDEQIEYIKKLVQLEDVIFTLKKDLNQNISHFNGDYTDDRKDIFNYIFNELENSLNSLNLDTSLLNKEKEEINEIISHPDIYQDVNDAFLKVCFSYFNVNSDLEFVGAIIKKNVISTEFRNYNTNVLPKILITKVNNAVVGSRSEIENAFIWNLKLRNYSDTFVYYQVYKHFPDTAKSFEDPNFIENCINASNEVKLGIREYSNDNIWDKILKSYMKIQKINFNENSLGVNLEKFKYFLEFLYNQASIANSFTINLSLAKFSLLGHGNLSINTIKKYLNALEKQNYIEVEELSGIVTAENRYPFKIKLKDLSSENLALLSNPTVNLPCDGNQDLFLLPGINPRAQKIIQLLRDNENLTRKEIQSYFSNLNYYKSKINKIIRDLVEKKILVVNTDKSFSLTKEQFNLILERIKENFKKEADQLYSSPSFQPDDDNETYKEIKRLKKRINKSIAYKPENMKNQMNYVKSLRKNKRTNTF